MGLARITEGADTQQSQKDNSVRGQFNDYSLDDVRAASQAQSGVEGQASMEASNFQIMAENQNGDLYSVDANGNVDEFVYVDGDQEKSFKDIKRDENGEVTGFTDPNGNIWEKQPADPTSPFPAEREGGGWMYTNPETGEEPRSPVNLGNVTITPDGVAADGQNADYLETPERN